MSADNGLLINLKTFKVTYYSGDGEISAHKCKSLEDAVKKAQELDEEYQTEYGIKFINSIKT